MPLGYFGKFTVAVKFLTISYNEILTSRILLKNFLKKASSFSTARNIIRTHYYITNMKTMHGTAHVRFHSETTDALCADETNPIRYGCQSPYSHYLTSLRPTPYRFGKVPLWNSISWGHRKH